MVAPDVKPRESEANVDKLIQDAEPARILDDVIKDMSPYLTRGERQARIGAVLYRFWESGYVIVPAVLLTVPVGRIAAAAGAAGIGLGTLIGHAIAA